jgi:hypothetical protein
MSCAPRRANSAVRTVGEQYYGCLRIDVRRSGELYRKIEGWASAVTARCALIAAQTHPVS